MKILKIIISIWLYILLVIERILLLPFTNEVPTKMMHLVKLKEEAEAFYSRLFKLLFWFIAIFTNFYFLKIYGFFTVLSILIVFFSVELLRKSK